MAKYPGLRRRENGMWYVRKRVPADLGAFEPRSSVRISLETTDKKQAIRLYPFKLAAIEQEFEEKRNRLQTAGRTVAALKVGKLERLGERDIERMVLDWWALRASQRQPEADNADEIADIVAELDDDVRDIGNSPIDCQTVQSVADRLLIGAGATARSHKVGKIKTQVSYPTVDRMTPAYRYLCQLVGRALQTEVALAKDHLLARRDAPTDPLFNNACQGANTSARQQRLSDLFRAYRADRNAIYDEESTESKYGFPFRVMEEVLGAEKPVASITRADCLKVRAFFERLPPNAKKRFPKLSLTQAAEKADAEKLKRMAPNAVASRMQSVLAALRWAEDEGWGVKINSRDVVPERAPVVKRRGFQPDELHKLFQALAQFREAEPEKFWVPAIAVFTGARAGEICQLAVEDVVRIEGIPCLNLSLFDADGRRVAGKRLKTKTSERLVPLHPSLLNAGFIDFVDSQKDVRLFANLKKGPDGRYSHAFSKWFGRFKTAVGFKERSLVFHSFRHGFRDACRQADIAEETALALGGWASAGQATKYGDRAMVPVLDRAIKKLDFGGFSVDRLSQ